LRRAATSNERRIIGGLRRRDEASHYRFGSRSKLGNPSGI
jgi:hypothetical protein